MKKLFIAVLVLNLLVEALAAASLIASPASMFPAGQEMAAMWARIYGFGVAALSTAIFWIWPRRNNLQAVTPMLGLLMTFHISIFLALVTSAGQEVGVVIHSVLSVLLIILFVTRSKWCTE